MTLHTLRTLALTTLAAALVLAGCNAGAPGVTEVPLATQAAQTVQAMLTQVSLAATSTATVALPPPSATLPPATPTLPMPLLPSATASLIFTPAFYGTAGVHPTLTTFCNAAFFVGDIGSTRDGSVLAAGETYRKTWDVRNIGTCTWSREYRLVFNGGKHMDGPDWARFPQIVGPGDHLFLSVTMIAPAKPGTYIGYWMLQAPDGSKFGVGDNGLTPLTVKIVVP
ncbi:MAG: hypothetical protein A2Z30_00485 [Chloroflexi bacterium RBG_16_64_43]|nr:MAG: hypothetical protein A2Z30_00485 [Chloroflexi bacterium RBG_16_64_43]